MANGQKEKVYDEELYPLMEKVISICNKKGIGLLATFALDGSLCCTTATVSKQNVEDEGSLYCLSTAVNVILNGSAPVVSETCKGVSEVGKLPN